VCVDLSILFIMRYEIFVGLVALIAESDARSLRLHARDCSFTWPAYDGDTCESMANAWSISEADFVRYNPGVNCVALEPAKDYCVEWTGAPPNGPSNPTSTPTPTPSLSPTLTPTPTFTPSPTTRSTLFTSTIPSTIVVTPAPFPTPGACSSTPAGVVTPSPIQVKIFPKTSKYSTNMCIDRTGLRLHKVLQDRQWRRLLGNCQRQ
jgi:hypothetical protein